MYKLKLTLKGVTVDVVAGIRRCLSVCFLSYRLWKDMFHVASVLKQHSEWRNTLVDQTTTVKF